MWASWTHPPLSQRAQRRAEGERRRSRPALAGADLGPGGFLLRGLEGTGAGLDVEVLQDVVVDLGGDLLLLQHLPDGLVGGAGADGRALPRRRPPLQASRAQGQRQPVNAVRLTMETWGGAVINGGSSHECYDVHRLRLPSII